MRAGKLDREIAIETSVSTQDEYGSPIITWEPLATMRAQIVQGGTEEFFTSGEGVDASVKLVFRTRYVAGVTAQSRIIYDGRQFNIAEIKEIGRRHGLELRAGAAE